MRSSSTGVAALAQKRPSECFQDEKTVRVLEAHPVPRPQDWKRFPWDWKQNSTSANSPGVPCAQLSKLSNAAADHVIYGIECGRNAMPERAEEAFNEALKLDPKSVSALNGLAMCSFEKMELGRAEEWFRKAMKAGPNDCAEKMFAKIAALRKGEPWAKRAESRGKFWKRWQDTELTKLSDEQRRKRMAQAVARRRSG